MTGGPDLEWGGKQGHEFAEEEEEEEENKKEEEEEEDRTVEFGVGRDARLHASYRRGSKTEFGWDACLKFTKGERMKGVILKSPHMHFFFSLSVLMPSFFLQIFTFGVMSLCLLHFFPPSPLDL